MACTQQDSLEGATVQFFVVDDEDRRLTG